MLKNNGFYMFITKLKEKETLYLLNGGNIKKLSKLDINYYYNNLYKYSLYLKKRMRKYFDLQKKVSDEIKSIGGAGTIHGAIVDVDFNNHLYINPIDGSIIPYFAYDIVEKVVFRNIPSLLKYSVPELYSKYEDQNKNLKFSVILNTP